MKAPQSALARVLGFHSKHFLFLISCFLFISYWPISYLNKKQERNKKRIRNKKQEIRNKFMHKSDELEEKLEQLGEKIIELVKKALKNPVALPIVRQLVRSGTSIGANYMEANGASSKKDFKNKIHICKKEAKETMHWLRMLAKADDNIKEECRQLWQETKGLC